MDNITHTLVGAVIGRAGLDRRTPLAMATLMVGANLPDVDVISVFLGTQLSVRRGITHGVPALVILPFLLTGLMMLWDRWVRRRRDASLTAAVPGQLLLLATISILSHPFLDWLNTYGMRWLMPVVDKWFYGDTLFIVDPWLLAVLALGYLWSGRRGSPRPARVALVSSAVYIAAMMAGTVIVRSKVIATSGHPLNLASPALMVSPVPLNPFSRQVVLADSGVYRVGSYSLFGGEVRPIVTIPINREHPAVSIALLDPHIQRFMHWARFPFFTVTPNGRSTTVHIADARYSGREGGGWASVSITVISP